MMKAAVTGSATVGRVRALLIMAGGIRPIRPH